MTHDKDTYYLIPIYEYDQKSKMFQGNNAIEKLIDNYFHRKYNVPISVKKNLEIIKLSHLLISFLIDKEKRSHEKNINLNDLVAVPYPVHHHTYLLLKCIPFNQYKDKDTLKNFYKETFFKQFISIANYKKLSTPNKDQLAKIKKLDPVFKNLNMAYSFEALENVKLMIPEPDTEKQNIIKNALEESKKESNLAQDFDITFLTVDDIEDMEGVENE